MRFEILRQRVERAEARMERCVDRAKDSRGDLRHLWRSGWTVPRILIGGLAAGFLVGRAQPLARVGAVRWLQLLSTVSSMIASIRAAAASETAEDAAQTAAVGAATAEVAARAAPAQAAAAAEAAVAGAEAPAAPTYRHAAAPGRVPTGTAPAPAEAATEISER